ncbi:hypothetical protein PG991_013425 [Apiospora marii]|uniref:Uncharacterized protein n=1 Tax=Apiospora marii TaxID=335849 RepID=A0ABR1R6B5_9PEZI
MDQDNAAKEDGAGSKGDPGRMAVYVTGAIVCAGLLVSIVFFCAFTRKRSHNTAVRNPGSPKNIGFEPQPAGATQQGDLQDGHGSFETPQDTAQVPSSHGNTILDKRTTKPQFLPRQHHQPGPSPYHGDLSKIEIGDNDGQDVPAGRALDCNTSSEGTVQLGRVSRQPDSRVGASHAPHAQLRADHGMQRNVSVLSRPLSDYHISSAASVSPVSPLGAEDQFNRR